MFVNKLGPDRVAGQKALDPDCCRQQIPLIARPLSEIPNCAW